MRSALHSAFRRMKSTSFHFMSTPCALGVCGVILLLFWQYYSRAEDGHLMSILLHFWTNLVKKSKWQADNIAEGGWSAEL